MKVLYIGQYKEGGTSKMRGEVLKKIIQASVFDVINTNIPFDALPRWQRSLAFRYKIGPAISRVNQYIEKELTSTTYDLVWIDKAVFVNKMNIECIRTKAKHLLHYTPDCAFYENSSRYFYNSIQLYDTVVTTKSFELNEYNKRLNSSQNLIVTTQGFDKSIHKLKNLAFEDKKDSVCFIGLNEPYRERFLGELLEADISVTLAGYGWEKFREKYRRKKLSFLGTSLTGNAYSEAISSCRYAWGALSKRFPELHTTRTFEIPACGTILLTEYNKEISSFFTNEEVVFYADSNDLVNKLKALNSDDEKQLRLAINGNKRVIEGGFDYHSILKDVLTNINLTKE